MPESMRERKKQRTRDALVAAGMRLFEERGFQAVTVADIATEADIAARTFHRYFPDKVELLFAHDEDLGQIVRAALQESPPGTEPATLVRSLMDAVAPRLAGNHSELVVRDRLIQQAPGLRDRDLAKRAALEDLVAEHLAQRLGVSVEEDVRPRWWAGVAFVTFTAGYRVWLAQGGDLTSHLADAAGQLGGIEHAPPAAGRT